MADVTSNITSQTQTSTYAATAGKKFSLVVSGNFKASGILQRSVTSANNWVPVMLETNKPLVLNQPGMYLVEETKGADYRVDVQVYERGTMTVLFQDAL